MLPCCKVPLDVWAPLIFQSCAVCWVFLARVMPRRQRNLSRESRSALWIGLWQGSTWLNKNQPDVVSPRWICNNLGVSNFLGDWHNYTQTNWLNSHIFINMKLKFASLCKPGEQQQKPEQWEVLVTCLIPNTRGLVKSQGRFQPAVKASEASAVGSYLLQMGIRCQHLELLSVSRVMCNKTLQNLMALNNNHLFSF